MRYSLDKTRFTIALVFFAIGALCGFLLGKGIYQPTYGEKVARDTVILRDTVPDYHPVPVDSATVKYITRYLPVVKHDTVSRVELITMRDSVAVEVPITSKHYQAKDYDAWVSGFEPSLDSIFVYREKEIITETITRTVKEDKHFFLDVGAGCEYKFNNGGAVPFAELGFKFKKGKWGVGAYGGYAHDIGENKASPVVKVKAIYNISSF